ncbi:MAG: hypothetical protein HYX78_03770 [Armatimonadetes bacterium]|nr:hypothetical protein [Armatimonadota bacterium]
MNSVIVESGDLAAPAVTPHTTTRLEAAAEALRLMGYTAIGVGPMDVLWKDEYYDILKQKGLQIVQIDTVDHAGALPYVIKEIGGLKVGVVSFGAVAPDRRESMDLLKLRYKLYAEVRGKCDVLILLDQANVATENWLERTGQRIGQPDVVVGGTPRIGLKDPKWVGSTMIVPTSTKGTHVGCVDIEVTGTDKKMTYSRTSLDPSIADDQEILKLTTLPAAKPPVVKPPAPAPVTNPWGARPGAVVHQDSPAMGKGNEK